MAAEEERVVLRCRPYATFAQPPRHLHRNDQADHALGLGLDRLGRSRPGDMKALRKFGGLGMVAEGTRSNSTTPADGIELFGLLPTRTTESSARRSTGRAQSCGWLYCCWRVCCPWSVRISTSESATADIVPRFSGDWVSAVLGRNRMGRPARDHRDGARALAIDRRGGTRDRRGHRGRHRGQLSTCRLTVSMPAAIFTP